jgi:hypothetical protein
MPVDSMSMRALIGDAGAPLVLGFEIDDGLEHLDRRRIRCRRGAPGFAEHARHLGKAFDDVVRGLQQLGRFGDRHAGHAHRHVHQRALVQCRHKFRSKPLKRDDGRCQDEQGDEDGRQPGAQNAGDDRPVEPDECPVNRVAGFGKDPAAHEKLHQDRHQRDREQRGPAHGEGLGESQRFEEAPFLILKREHRKERHGDHGEAEEQRRSDLQRGIGEDFRAACSGRGAFEMLVSVLDHDNRGIDHGAERDRDAAEAHDVGAKAERVQQPHGDQHADGQHQDGDERTAHMQQKDDADERDDDALFGQCVLQRLDRAMNEIGAVIDRLDADPLRQGRGDLGEFLLDAVDHMQRVLAVALQRNAAHHFALAVELGDAATLFGPELDARYVAQQHRRAALHLEGDLFEIVGVAQIAAATHDVFGLRHLDHAPADIAIVSADRARKLGERETVGLQFLRIDDDLVLLNEAADACDFGHALGLGELIAQIPVLDCAQFGERALGAEHNILIHPADTGRVGSKRGGDALG